eukprot:TRINITY_DN1788_c0_g2_i1.p1 TRINITY_DN1788_c0_g2~~TRINITY_DN1788_c0_g2_i1.p1  ORF type:complete len:527 (-),score=131.13 TRINITY_DN1788_c0_g2_i1:50-1630(-)
MMSMTDSDSGPSTPVATTTALNVPEISEHEELISETKIPQKNNDEFQCVIIGDLKVGKTLICSHFFGDSDGSGGPSHTTHYTKKLQHNTYSQINALDTAGDSNLRTMFTSIKGNAFVVVFDVYNRSSFVLAEEIIRSVITEIHSRESSDSVKVGVKGEVLFVLVGNTQHEEKEKIPDAEKVDISTETIVSSDLEDDGTRKEKKREVHFMEAVILANHYGARYIEINATSGNNVATIFWTAARDFLEYKGKAKIEKTDSNYKKPYSRTISLDDLKGPLISSAPSTLEPLYSSLEPILSSAYTATSDNFPISLNDVPEDIKDQVKESLVYLSPSVDIVTDELSSLRASHRVISSSWDGSIHWDEWNGKSDAEIKGEKTATNNNNNNNSISFYETMLIGVEEVANIVKSTSTRLSFRLEHGKVLLGGGKKSEKSERTEKTEKTEKSPTHTLTEESDLPHTSKENTPENSPERERKASFYETVANSIDIAVQSLPPIPIPRPHLKGSNNTNATTDSKVDANQKGKNCKIM